MNLFQFAKKHLSSKSKALNDGGPVQAKVLSSKLKISVLFSGLKESLFL